MFTEFLEKELLGNRIEDYLISLLMFIGSLAIIKVLRFVFLKRLKQWSEKNDNKLNSFFIEILEKKVVPILYWSAFYFALSTLTLQITVSRVVTVTMTAFLTFLVIRLTVSLVAYLFQTFIATNEESESRKKSLQSILTVLKVLIWGIGIVFLLDNLGFKISAVVAGLGIGGIAVALAAQKILGDLFSYFAIFFDKPFEVGDFIIIDNHLGAVEYIGIKTTRIRSLSGEQLVFANTDLTDARLRNFKRMEKRRVVFTIGVTYQTSRENLKRIPEIIKQIITDEPDATFDRSHFFQYGDFSLNYETVYFVLTNDYNKYMDIQQRINFKLHEEFEKHNIDFAYPTQTLFVQKQGNN